MSDITMTDTQRAVNQTKGREEMGRMIKKKDVIISWDCPYCGYKISDIEYKSFICDVRCPRCHESLGYFHRKVNGIIKSKKEKI